MFRPEIKKKILKKDAYLTGVACVSLNCMMKSVQRVAATREPTVGTCIVVNTLVDWEGVTISFSIKLVEHLKGLEAVSLVPELLSS